MEGEGTRSTGEGWRGPGSLGFWLLGGSWVVISGAITRVTIVISHIRGLITRLITTHEAPSRRCKLR